jgi:hypothetical protein
VDVTPPDDPFVGALVDWRRTGQRIRRSAVLISAAAVLAWLVVGFVTGRPRVGDLGTYVFFAIAAMIVVEFVVVGGSALRGMLRAGERGERLASGDVMLLPPQVRRKR